MGSLWTLKTASHCRLHKWSSQAGTSGPRGQQRRLQLYLRTFPERGLCLHPSGRHLETRRKYQCVTAHFSLCRWRDRRRPADGVNDGRTCQITDSSGNDLDLLQRGRGDVDHRNWSRDASLLDSFCHMESIVTSREAYALTMLLPRTVHPRG